ncbi:MAG: hypothetical protein WA989_04405 [Henriciella sp.]|uniref:hypothetical protein n=1 Tax=Henriciella sp. TaxID=1968823 RepID=UPI003C729373
MKIKLLTATAGVIALAMPAFAASSSESFDVEASVPESCLMEDIGMVDLSELDIVRSSGPDALSLESNATGNGGDFYLSCNLENSVTISTANGGLTNSTRSLDADDDPVFTDTIEYRVRLDNYVDGGNGAQPKLTTKDGGAGYSTTSAQRGAIHRQVQAQVTILRADNPLRPLAGDYSDTVTVEVSTL